MMKNLRVNFILVVVGVFLLLNIFIEYSQQEILKTNSSDDDADIKRDNLLNHQQRIVLSLFGGENNSWISVFMIFVAIVGASLFLKGTEISNLLNNYILSPKDINREIIKKRTSYHRASLSTSTSSTTKFGLTEKGDDSENKDSTEQCLTEKDDSLNEEENITPSRVIKPTSYQANIIHKDVRRVLITRNPLNLKFGDDDYNIVANLPQALQECDNIKTNDASFYEPEDQSVSSTTTTVHSNSGRYGIDLEDEEDEEEDEIVPIIPIEIISILPERNIPIDPTLEKFTEIYSKKLIMKTLQQTIPTTTTDTTTNPQIKQQEDVNKVINNLQTKKQQSKQAMHKELQDILTLVQSENEQIRKIEQEHAAKIEAEKIRIAKLKAEQERIAREKLLFEEEQRRAANLKLEEEKKMLLQKAQQATTTTDINVSPIKPNNSSTNPPSSSSESSEPPPPPEKSVDISIVNPYTGPKKSLTIPKHTRPKTYVIAKIYIDRMEEMYASFQKRTDPKLKPEMDTAKKLINKTINRITETNQREIVREINQIMNKQKVNKDVFNFCLYFYARTIVDQAASQTGDLKKLLPFIEVTSDLMNNSPEILDAVIGYIHTNCIFTIPFFPSDVIDAADFKKQLGFKEEDGEMETQTQFMNRMNDIITIYAMIIQNNPPGHKYGIEKGWEWMAAFLNSRPSRFTLEILDSFLRIAGYKLHQTYKTQFAKILDFIDVHMIANPPEGSDKASLSRFSDLLSNFKKTKQISKPSFLE